MKQLKKLLPLSAVAFALSAATPALADGHNHHHMHGNKTVAPEGSEAYIISPKNGDVVSSTFTVKFGLRGMGVAPAGIQKDKTGHHHLLIDGELPDMGKPLGKNVKHFGGGQTEAQITLAPGQHTLQLVLGDHLHMPHNPPVVSEKVTITVK